MKFDIAINKLNGHDQEGKVGKINKRQGDSVKPGDTIFTLESGKGSIKYESEYDGKIVSLSIDEGQTVKKGQIVGSIEGEIVQKKAAEKQSYSFGMAKAKKEIHDVDVAIVGGGPGGYVAAVRGAQLGLKVAIIEKDRMGGTCLNRGCIPTKAIASSVDVLRKIKDSSAYGIEIDSYTLSMSEIIKRKNTVVDTLVGGIEHLMDSNEIIKVEGNAQIAGEKSLSVKTKKIDATINYKNLIIATGSSTFMLPIEGSDIPEILTSDTILDIEEVPESLTIIGGGVIGMEFAFIFRELGAEVNVVEFAPEILVLLDQDVVDVIKVAADEKGIKVMTGAAASRLINSENGQIITVIKKGEEEQYLASTHVLMAVGRKANIDSLELEKIGVELNGRKNGIEINDKCQTTNPDVYAIGDVTNKIQLAHVASHQGMVAMENIAGLDAHMQYEVIPSAIFTHPEIGNVGMTEKEAIEKGIAIKVGKFPLMANGKALCMGEPEGFVKIIAEEDSEQIIGGVVIGIHGTDMVATLANLIAEKRKLAEAQHVVYAHPTTAESIHEALLSANGKAIHFG